MRGEVRWEGLLDKERPGVHDGVQHEAVGFCRRSGRGAPRGSRFGDSVGVGRREGGVTALIAEITRRQPPIA